MSTTPIATRPRSFHDLLQRYRGQPPGVLGERAATEVARSQLKEDIEQILRRNSIVFIVIVAMIVALFTAEVYVVLTNLGKPTLIKEVIAAFGISVAVLIQRMIALWREKNALEILLALALSLEGPTLQTVIDLLAKRF